MTFDVTPWGMRQPLERLGELRVQAEEEHTRGDEWATVARGLIAEVERLRDILTHPTTLVALRAAYKSPSSLGLDDSSDGWPLYQAALACQVPAPHATLPEGGPL